MATWQFDLHCLPSDALRRYYEEFPSAITREEFEQRDWWEAVTVPHDLKDQLSTLLPSTESWSEYIQKWGEEDGNRIDLVYQNEHVADLFVRVDVRNISYVFLSGLIKLVQRNGWLMVTERGDLIQPSVANLLSSIRRSDAFRYVENPKDFLAKLTNSQKK